MWILVEYNIIYTIKLLLCSFPNNYSIFTCIPVRRPGTDATNKCRPPDILHFLQLWQLHILQLESRSLTFSKWHGTRRGKTADQTDEAFHSPAPNKHSNTSVKSNNFTINEIPICLQCISRWHFPHCNSALIKFLKCKNASKRLKTSPGVSVPGRGLWYLIFIAMCPGLWKPEC